LAGAELYDPATGNCTSTYNSMSVTRYGDIATLLRNGKVLLAGREVVEEHQETAVLYDLSPGAFASTGSIYYGWPEHTAQSECRLFVRSLP
jgi:hypothetical protein